MTLTGSETIDLSDQNEELVEVIGSNSTPHNVYDFFCDECEETHNRIKFFSMTLRPEGADNRDKVARFCREENIIGQGWGPTEPYESAKEFLRHRRDKADEPGNVDSSIRNFVAWMEPDDIVFIYDKLDSQYYLVKVDGGWECRLNADLSSEKRELYKNHDIRQFRSAEWYPVPRRNLTGAILSTTPPRPTVQKRKNLDKDQAEYLAWLQDEPDVDRGVDIVNLKDNLRQRAFGDNGDPGRILEPLSFDELETIIVSYVQRHTDAVLMQNTTVDDLPDIESLLRAVDADGRPRTIGIQVTRGGVNAEGDLRNFLENADELYIYCNGGIDIEGATEITDREVAEYMCYYAGELPPTALVRLSRVFG